MALSLTRSCNSVSRLPCLILEPSSPSTERTKEGVRCAQFHRPWGEPPETDRTPAAYGHLDDVRRHGGESCLMSATCCHVPVTVCSVRWLFSKAIRQSLGQHDPRQKTMCERRHADLEYSQQRSTRCFLHRAVAVVHSLCAWLWKHQRVCEYCQAHHIMRLLMTWFLEHVGADTNATLNAFCVWHPVYIHIKNRLAWL